MGPWTLWAGEELVGEVVGAEPDQPWFFGAWQPTEAFEAYRSLFEEELSLLEAAEERWDEYDRCYGQIREALQLKTPAGSRVAEWILHVDGSQAWFRFEMEPFTGP